jgi:hypothetical protein
MKQLCLVMSPILALGATACGDDGGGGGHPDAAVADAAPVADAPPPQPDAAPQIPPNVDAVFTGELIPIGGGDLGGQVLLVRSDQGTLVSVHGNGLTESTMYPVHVHSWPCSADDGGGHYKKDPTVGTTEETNEIWLTLSTGAGSSIYNVWKTTSHAVRGDALSVVVHDDGGAKLMCADLALSDSGTVTATGTMAPFAAADMAEGDDTIAGTATLVRDFDGGEISYSVDLTGLNDAKTYVAHVHNLPCDVDDAGGHYKIDPTVVDTQEANELWIPEFTPTAGAFATTIGPAAGAAREDAQSLVIHRVEMGSSPKVACADLDRPSYPDRVTSGDYVQFGGGAGAGSGTLTRGIDGDTTATITMTGLSASTDYGVHVHRLPCAIGDGGGHYKADPDVADNTESNEIWLGFTTDGTGAGMGTGSITDHIAHANAQSIVVHAANGDRLGCVDLK